MSSCTLRFTRDSPLRTTLVDEATGHVRYQIDTPMRIVGSVTRIRKFDSSTQPPIHRDNNPDPGYDDDITDKGRKKKKACDDITDMGRKKKSLSDTTSEGKRQKAKKDKKQAEMEFPGTSEEIARIYWKWFSSDRIIFRGRIHPRTQFLPKCGKMRRSYMFTGPDSVQYRWALGRGGTKCPKLVTYDEKKTVIAEFHRARHWVKKRKARLEVQPAGMEMLDDVILTFVFADNKRREREARARAAGGG